MRETDLLLGPFADASLSGLDAKTLDLYEALLEENDQDLYVWISRSGGFPDRYRPILERIARFHARP